MLGQGSFMAICGIVYLKINFTKGKVFYTVLEAIIFYDISLVRFVCDAEYANACKRKDKMTVKGDGIVDSVGYCNGLLGSAVG